MSKALAIRGFPKSSQESFRTLWGSVMAHHTEKEEKVLNRQKPRPMVPSSLRAALPS